MKVLAILLFAGLIARAESSIPLAGQTEPVAQQAKPLPTPIAITPDPGWLAKLATLTTQAAQTAPELEKLIRDSQTQSKTTTLAGFLATIRICDAESSQAARVNQVSNQRYFFIPRDLDETPNAKEPDLIKFYLAKLQTDPPKDLGSTPLSWHFGPDVIIAHTADVSRTMCIRSGLSPDDAVEVLAHEMVHLTRGLTTNTVDSALKAKDARDYAERTVDELGDEIDAYIEEDSLRIRRRGEKFYYANPQLAAYFNDYGTFVGRREKMAAFILDELWYMKNRFHGEYRSLLQNQLSYEKQLLSFSESLQKTRNDDVTNLSAFMQGRVKVLSAMWPSYGTETQRGRKLLDAATDSEKRLTTEIPKVKQRIATLQARLKVLEVAP